VNPITGLGHYLTCAKMNQPLNGQLKVLSTCAQSTVFVKPSAEDGYELMVGLLKLSLNFLPQNYEWI